HNITHVVLLFIVFGSFCISSLEQTHWNGCRNNAVICHLTCFVRSLFWSGFLYPRPGSRFTFCGCGYFACQLAQLPLTKMAQLLCRLFIVCSFKSLHCMCLRFYSFCPCTSF